jgi:hypothetical protein
MEDHPNFTGVWRADFEQSNLQIEAPKFSEFTIQHEEPVLLLSRIHRAEGYEDAFSLRLSTDGKESVVTKASSVIKCTCVWQGNSLQFLSKILGKGFEATNTVTYTLSEDGQEILADERYEGPPKSYHNVWVLVRQHREGIHVEE